MVAHASIRLLVVRCVWFEARLLNYKPSFTLFPFESNRIPKFTESKREPEMTSLYFEIFSRHQLKIISLHHWLIRSQSRETAAAQAWDWIQAFTSAKHDALVTDGTPNTANQGSAHRKRFSSGASRGAMAEAKERVDK